MTNHSAFKRTTKRRNMKPKSKSKTVNTETECTWFDKEHPERYVGKWCLYKKSYEHEYTKVYIYDVKNGIVKYRTSHGSNECYCPQEEFDCCEFIVSPFDNDYSMTDDVKIDKISIKEIYVGDPPQFLGEGGCVTSTHVEERPDPDHCRHEWFETILTCYPPIVQRTCRKCGKTQHIPHKQDSMCQSMYPDDQFVDGPF